jgi:hypothetical protein
MCESRDRPLFAHAHEVGQLQGGLQRVEHGYDLPVGGRASVTASPGCAGAPDTPAGRSWSLVTWATVKSDSS